jgi:3-dehydroquinate synthase
MMVSLLRLLQGSLLIGSVFSFILSPILLQRPRSRLLVAKETVEVDLGDRSYPIYVGEGLLDTADIICSHIMAKKALIVTNTIVGPLYLAKVQALLEGCGIEAYSVQLPDGEEFKNMETLMMILDSAMDCRLDRKSVMVALGGGVVGDMTG